jgi:uncharacterized membrane protein
MEEKVEEKKPDSEETEENVLMAVIAYFLFFVPLLTDSKDDPFVKFHVKQSLLIFCLNLAVYMLRFFPVIGWTMWRIRSITSLALLALFIVGIINAVNKEKKELPFIGKYADQIFKF